VDDKHVADRIDELARKEHELFELEAKGKASESQQAELKEIQVRLDQWWDLLRQRRARREFGQNPDDAHMRDEKTVENYIG
jgi:Protein of unknown function (DUF2630)